MTNKEQVLEVIYASIDDLNEQASSENKLMKSPETVLFGRNGKLDSLGLVNLIVDIEQRVDIEMGIEITLADERAMSQESSPFKTIGSLADYILTLINEIG